MKGKLGEIIFYDRDIFLHDPLQKLLCLVITGHTDMVLVFLFCKDLGSYRFDLLIYILFRLEDQVHAAIGFLDIIQVSGYHYL